MQASEHTAPVPTGLSEPAFRAGFGTFDSVVQRFGESGCTDVLVAALETGYRHFDTADMYGTEPRVAAAIARTGLEDEVVVATKLHTQDLGSDDALDRLETPVFAHQVELHPLLHEPELHRLAVEHGHWLVGFAPTTAGLAGAVAELRQVADQKGPHRSR